MINRKILIVRILMILGLILPAIVPVESLVLAQEGMNYFSFAHNIYTSEYGIENPEGMVYSPNTDSFVVLGMGNYINIITLQAEIDGKSGFTQYPEDPLNAAFDNFSNSLFIIGGENTELSKITVDQTGLANTSNKVVHFSIKSFDLWDAQGMTLDPTTGRLFILDAGRQQILIVSPHPVEGFDGTSATANNRIRRVSLTPLSQTAFRGIAFHPNNGHIYIGSPSERKIYELTEAGEMISTYDITGLNLEKPLSMLFAPSQDRTDDPDILDLYILDGGQVPKHDTALATDHMNTSQKGQIVELSLQAPTALPPGTTLLPGSLVRTIDTSKTAWNPSSPDPSGIDYWPLTNRLLIVDSEVEEMPNYFQGKNVFQSTTLGTLTNTCSTISYTTEPTGVAINPNNNHIFISDDIGSNDTVHEVSLGPDGTYCTADDTVTSTNVNSLYNVNDAEDVAYGNNTLFIAGGINAEVYRIPLGLNGVLGGGDDGAMTHFDTNGMGFSDLEGIGYNLDSGTLFIISTIGTERYLGETTISGTLLRAYDLSFMGSAANLRSDVTYAPSSQNSLIKNIYIASRGVDNDVNQNENDGKVWEISISSSAQVNVNIGGNSMGNYNIPVGESKRVTYNVDDGPVKVASTNTLNIITALRDAISQNGVVQSWAQLMGLPDTQLSTTYYFPAYNNVTLSDQLRFANLGAVPTTVTVKIGSVVNQSYVLQAGEGLRVSYPGVDSGPVTVSSNSQLIIAAMREAWSQNGVVESWVQMMGLPASQVSTTYYFPAYNNVGLSDQLRFANLGAVPTTVTVKIGSVVNQSYVLQAGEGLRVSYPGVDSGPVTVSSNGQLIIAALRDAWSQNGVVQSWAQLMGLPASQLSTTYYFPIYNNVSLSNQLRFANLGNSQTTVTVKIGSVVNQSYVLQAGESKRVSYAGVNTGPVTVSSNGQLIIAALRDAWSQNGVVESWVQLMGLPASQLSDIYYFPAYNNVTLSDELSIAVP